MLDSVRPVRSAELRRSRLTEFVPIPLIAAGMAASVISLFAAIAFLMTESDRSRGVAHIARVELRTLNVRNGGVYRAEAT